MPPRIPLERKSREFPKKKELSEKRWSLSGSDSVTQKRAFARLWLHEARYRRYRYYVEKCTDGKWIYLARPTSLNKGVDFQVGLEDFKGGTRHRRSERPSHDNVIRDLRRKLKEKPRLANALFRAVCAVYDCVDPRLVIRRDRRLLQFTKGRLPIEKTLLILKWMFIEQDITYWLGTGRNMLMHAIEKRVFGLKGHLISKSVPTQAGHPS
jgi:hypothetical protein